MPTTIRAATRDDIDVVLRMAREWVIEDITWGQQAVARDYLKARIGGYFLVAEQSEVIVGYIFGDIVATPLAVFHDSPYLNIEEIYVVPTERSCGIGGALLKALIRATEDAGVYQFHVFSGTKDQNRIVAFYEHHGFRTWGTQLYRTS
ncbi:MAG: N-acetyltransferase family protein [Promethearchaeota archaeon]|jgi:GNAT superfamily N-acetyltransferase